MHCISANVIRLLSFNAIYQLILRLVVVNSKTIGNKVNLLLLLSLILIEANILLSLLMRIEHILLSLVILV